MNDTNPVMPPTTLMPNKRGLILPPVLVVWLIGKVDFKGQRGFEKRKWK